VFILIEIFIRKDNEKNMLVIILSCKYVDENIIRLFKVIGTLECSKLDSKTQNTSHWGVLGVIEKVLKRRYRKWPRISHLDICRLSYGQKKGRESNWQFDSRPLKVGNRPLPDIRIESAIRRWKDDDKGYKFGLDLVAIRLRSREL